MLKRWVIPAIAGLLAFGAVSLGSGFERTANAANQNWNYIEEGLSGCTTEETNEYHRNGSFRQEVMIEVDLYNREEVLELTGRSQNWCRTLMIHISYSYSNINWWTGCESEYRTLGY
jgi:hypothetical protein